MHYLRLQDICCPGQTTYDCMISCFVLCHVATCKELHAHRRNCQPPVSGGNTKRFLQFRLGCIRLPIAAGRCAGVVRASRHCTVCGAGVMKGIRSLSVHLWRRYRLSMLTCSLPLRIPSAPCCAERLPEGLLLHLRLLTFYGHIPIATRWHMRSDLSAG